MTAHPAIRAGSLDIPPSPHITVPSRELARQERAVYRAGQVKKALMDVTQQTQEYAGILEGKIAEATSAVIETTVTNLLAGEDSITDPRVKQLVHLANEQLLQNHVRHQLGYAALAAQQLAELQSRDITPPPHRPLTLWERLNGGSDE